MDTAEAERPHGHDAAQCCAAMYEYSLSAPLLILAELSFTRDRAVVMFACPVDKGHFYTRMKSPTLAGDGAWNPKPGLR